MKKNLRILPILLSLIMIFMLIPQRAYLEEKEKSIIILFTHDMHDHLYPFDVEEDGVIKTLGGYARLNSTINKEREKAPNLLLVDGGDFSMGTLFQTIFASHSPGIRLMGKMGYDVVTFGNHEFDFRADGLAYSLKAAKDSGEFLPQIVASNISFPLDDNGQLTPALTELKNSMEYYGVEDYTVIERNGIKIGIFGLMGKEAASNAPMSEVEFTDPIQAARDTVQELKNEEKVDLIICLSHSGTWEDKSKSEDEILAKEVPDIDIIISGHTHTTLIEPIIVGNTIIASSGRYGENLGVLNLVNDEEKWRVKDYRLEPIEEHLALDPEIAETIEYYKEIVQEEYLDRFNMVFDEVVAYTPFNFTSYGVLGKDHDEDILGNLISDSYIYAVKEAEGEDYEPIAASVVPTGTIRGSFIKGYITVSDVFNVSSLGIGPDKVSGYPLISVYLTGKELKTVAEVDASIAPIMSVAQLYTSGLNFTFNPNRLIFNKVTDVYLQKEDGSREEVRDDELYRVVAGLYSAQMLSIVGDKSFGLLSIVPKTKEGLPITDYEAQIIYDEGHEIKEWLAIAEYLKSFDKENGVPQVPLYYSQKQGRKIVDDNPNLFARLKNPNKVTLVAYSVVLFIIALIILLIGIIIKKKKKVHAK
ncbi:5'-nucleotidase/2',3'-cyclic phosphodiesterase-like hydrolase [[Clostridium] ultunense Esp]|uniref:5'-nucleotidase/2',3'-cyclic phosphodiesterase-like hydrolase n=1 Tax=[Clostridium] ultunense Esp TaxID=1288971 RepID=M1ZGD1_9FIRM|nr:bifunctional UDP-sugar hydrolase/5'-nucleotidase [Schnuerera ultunensis]CCQ92817.1 5'-nucleotidase/2',3'-cyclic phosphodiesterase-like hydrolase [[Clostridium] ultunense Esp]SHD75830.1 5'-nucleotidase/2',3'-cyclic phosphodiesterase-like hydrolase [[Clostridium] ultunense Esp]